MACIAPEGNWDFFFWKKFFNCGLKKMTTAGYGSLQEIGGKAKCHCDTVPSHPAQLA